MRTLCLASSRHRCPDREYSRDSKASPWHSPSPPIRAALSSTAGTDTETRLYPGGAFDPLGLASNNEEQTFRLKTAEIKHARLAMVSALGRAPA